MDAAQNVLRAAAVTAAARPPVQVLTFFLDGGEYAVPILHVQEIATYRAVTPVPTTPPWIRGVMNLRGTVVPVIDLREKLALGQTSITGRTCLVIVGLTIDEHAMVMAVAVDAVNRVVDVPEEDVQDPPGFGTGIDVAFVEGLIQIDGRLVLLLDLTRILSLSELKILRDDVAETGAPSPHVVEIA